MSNTNLQSTKKLQKQKGRVLSNFDQEQRTLNSGTHGAKRLVMNIALDFQEKYPELSWDDALKLACGYCDRTHG